MAYHYGWVDWFVAADKTQISLAIAVAFLIATAVAGVLIHIGQYRDLSKYLRFVADIFPAIGLLGTIVGFMIMFSENSLMGAIGNEGQARALMASITQGASTAMLTTISGLIASVLLRLQLLFYRARFGWIDLF